MLKIRTALILLFSIGIALFYGLIILRSWNTFLSIVLIGLWILFTIKFFQKRKEYKEYNSPKNTSFFLLCPLGVALFYSIWSYFTGFWGENLLEDFFPRLYISLWIIIFALPYFLYSLSTLRSCFTKFYVIYIFRTRSLNARKFVIFYVIFILFVLISYMVYYNIVVFYYFFYIVQQTYYFSADLMLILVCCVLIYFFVRHAIFGSPRAVPELSSDYLARRRRQLEGITSTPLRPASPRATPTTPSRPVVSRSATTRTSRPATTHPSTPSTSRPTTSRPTIPPVSRSTPSQQRAVSRPTPSRQRAVARPSYEKLMPKAGILSLEDFKCIFCFELPKMPADERRGIIICPNCRHPAHADEFKGWAQASPLCSRCDAPIPPSFLRNPKVIPVKTYLEVIKEYKRKG
ncbi:MAG: hypothetical protein EU540_00445 [Promethearchaeota archaeon]|nr:MAG: hypothetical protein EU540_00445 [Candidatus Lokiarchaeota archaeon]